jgi:hypothetical protein
VKLPWIWTAPPSNGLVISDALVMFPSRTKAIVSSHQSSLVAQRQPGVDPDHLVLPGQFGYLRHHRLRPPGAAPPPADLLATNSAKSCRVRSSTGHLPSSLLKTPFAPLGYAATGKPKIKIIRQNGLWCVIPVPLRSARDPDDLATQSDATGRLKSRVRCASAEIVSLAPRRPSPWFAPATSGHRCGMGRCASNMPPSR